MYSAELVRNGVVVIPTDFDCARLREVFDRTLTKMPCFKPNAKVFVFGGYGALGTPDSFHNPFVRGLRLDCLEVVEPILRQIDPAKKVEMLVDRMMYRPAGVFPTAATWHRDESPNALSGDHMFGGWINLGHDPQTLSCVLGTHRPGVNWSESTPSTGFFKFNQKDAKDYAAVKTRVLIPVGSIVLFYENLVHEVCTAAYKNPFYRLHLAWRLTHADKPLIAGLDSLLDAQAPMPLKSGQAPPMWTANHWRFHSDKIEEFSQNLRDDLCETIVVRKKRRVRRVPRHMKGLRDLGLPLYEPYSVHERALYHPY